MKRVFVILFLFSSYLSYAQIGKIKLPQGEEEFIVSKSTPTPIISIYVNNEKEIYFEKEQIKVHEIGKLLKLYKYQLNEEISPFIRVFLYLDESVNYSLVDEIKTEIAKANILHVVYKTNSIDDIDFLKGIYWRCHLSLFKINNIEKQISEVDIKANEDLINNMSLMNIPPPPAPPAIHWYYKSLSKIYSIEQDVIDEVLNNNKTTCLKLSNKGLETESKTFKLAEDNVIKSLFLNNDILFLSFDSDLKYSNYLKTIKAFKTIIKELEFEKQKFAFVIELSSEIMKIHKKTKISLCN